jgi:PAS domain S-box-containing protein
MTTRQSRNVSLTPELDAFIGEAMASGDYGNASEVVRTALKLLRERGAPPRHTPFPVGGGETGEMVRRFDWGRTSLGPIDGWSREMRATVSNVVNSPVPKVLMWGPDHIMIYNDAYSVIAGGNHPRALGGTTAAVWPEIWDWNRAILERGFAGETVDYRDQPMTLLRGGAAEELFFDLFYTPVYEAEGHVGGVLCTVIDNTARLLLERRLAGQAEALASANARFRAAMEAMHGVLWTNDADGRMVGEQPGWALLTGQGEAEYSGYGWADAVHPDDAAPTIAAWERAVATKSTFVFEHRVRRHCGTWRTFAIRGVPLIGDAGEIVEWVGVHSDITHQRAAEAALRDHAQQLERQVRHRERAEEQLRHLNETLEARVIDEIATRREAEAKLAQAQKMEAVGKLTGGVAHDFNNLLQVVSGNLQLLARDVAGNERAEKRIGNALAGVARGSKLAAQLLAFGRRQALEPKVVNVTRFVRGMDDMLRRAIGEGIEIETVFGGGLWNTFIDPGQIENALLNLAINARDAMAGQGKLTIELANAHLDDDYARTHDEVAPGQYVMLAVSDTGCGMPPEVLDKVFEPFFSTKAEGKGSGLGLSMVYGFVKQSGGHVKIYSEPGEGTTIRLYLPRAVEAEDVEVEVHNGPIIGGTETVLVVEDDEEVRATVVEMLADLGYRVLKAVDAQSALNVIESGIPIDMLFTDVVMPGSLKSPELARKARERMPEIAVLFTSGYTENSIVHGGRLDAGVELLSKPYTREALARKFRHVLANQRQRNDAAVPPLTAPLDRVSSDLAPAPAAPARAATILLVEDDALIRGATAETLQDAGHIVVEAASAEEAMAALQTAPIDVLITDIHLPGSSGIMLAERARVVRPAMRIVIASGDTASIGDALPGAMVLAKPYNAHQLLTAIGGGVTVERRALEGESEG